MCSFTMTFNAISYYRKVNTKDDAQESLTIRLFVNSETDNLAKTE